MPICASRRASWRGARTTRRRLRTPSGSAGSPPPAALSPQCTGAPRSSAASRSSPSAAPSAVSKPRSTLICRAPAGNRSPVAAFRIFASVRASVSIRASSARASCSGGRAAFSAARASATAFSAAFAALSAPSSDSLRRFDQHFLLGGSASPAIRAAISAASRSTVASWRASRSRRSAVSRSARSIWLRAAAASARSAVSLASAASLERQRRGRLLEGRAASRSRARRRAAFSAIERRFLGVEPLQNIGIVADHLLFARDVGVELLQAAVELGLARANAAGLLLDLRLGDRQALEGGGGRGLGLAQFRQAMRADRLLLGGVHLRGGALADQRCRRRQAPTAPPPPAPWPASSADAEASPRPCGCRPTGS